MFQVDLRLELLLAERRKDFDVLWPRLKPYKAATWKLPANQVFLSRCHAWGSGCILLCGLCKSSGLHAPKPCIPNTPKSAKCLKAFPLQPKPKLQTLNPKSQILNPTPQALNVKPLARGRSACLLRMQLLRVGPGGSHGAAVVRSREPREFPKGKGFRV